MVAQAGDDGTMIQKAVSFRADTRDKTEILCGASHSLKALLL